jgi:hypothetical protein
MSTKTTNNTIYKQSLGDKIRDKIYSIPSYIGLLEVIGILIMLIILYKYNPITISNNISSNSTLFSKIVSLFSGSIYFIILFLLITLAIIKFIIWTGNNINAIFIYGLIISTLIGLVTLSILFIYFQISDKIPKVFEKINDFVLKNEVLSFMKQFVFFLPCLLIKAIDHLRYQYNITAKPIWILLLLEIILIALWYVLPKLFNYVINKYGIKLLDEPIYLNKEHTLGNFENLHSTIINSNNEKNNKFNYHYSISAWFYINPQPTNTSSAYNRYTSILNYGNKPNIQYNGQKNSLKITTSLGTNKVGGVAPEIEIFETTDILYQKWNHVVVNYDGGIMDVFLNGELVGSKSGIAPYMTYENVTSGENNGIHGGICNVIYYNEILSNRTIKLMYKMLKDKEIPQL